ncbi:MAG: hypothetical protein HY812_22000 [Planctomycetes bacterium]|nr:hypothetical protein [Planctomycetota bacterium]
MRFTLPRPVPAGAILFLALLGLVPLAAGQKAPVRLEQAVVAIEDRGLLGLEVALAPDLLGRLAGENRVVLANVPLPGGRAVDLRLERFDWPETSGLLAVNGSLKLGQALAAGMTFWSGSVPGDAASDVFLAFSASGTRGWVRSGGELVHLLARPGDTGRWKNPGQLLIRDQDFRDLGATPPMGCATPPPPSPRPALGKAPRTSPSFATSGRGFLPLIQARLAVETDWQFYSPFNDLDAARHYVLTLLGAASLRYEEQAGIVLLPVYVGLHDNANDPWTTPETPGATTTMLLNEFRQAWDQGAAPAVADLHHFLCSGFSDGGVAYLGTVCNADWSFGVSTGINALTPIPIVPGGAANWDFYVAAHEIGHNFDAIHTHEYCPTPLDECAPPGSFGPCQTQQVCTSSGTLMSYCHACPGAVANITTYFHAQSAADMRAFAEGSCLARLHGQTTRVSVSSAGFRRTGVPTSIWLSPRTAASSHSALWPPTSSRGTRTRPTTCSCTTPSSAPHPASASALPGSKGTANRGIPSSPARAASSRSIRMPPTSSWGIRTGGPMSSSTTRSPAPPPAAASTPPGCRGTGTRMSHPSPPTAASLRSIRMPPTSSRGIRTGLPTSSSTRPSSTRRAARGPISAAGPSALSANRFSPLPGPCSSARP